MYVTSSGLKTADATIFGHSALVYGVTLIPAAAASSVVLYDTATGTAAGTEMAKAQAVANGESVTITFNQPVSAENGIYADVTGASAAYIVYFCPCG